MKESISKIHENEVYMWEAAKNKDADAFMNAVAKDAVMICGEYRCSGAEYAQYILAFDVMHYQIFDFELIVESDDICQVHYIIETEVADKKNSDLEGKFHVTSTWINIEEEWKLIFNMDSRI